ncbi:hypothetical protein [Adlercreutzia muris]|uniref:hypothetical protein n=1 Tax=Adlercreutzia muris TaxID=1796610 RepID=UPI001F5663DF|nr:hypothetical protein [Adlercreutzia muris]
MRFQKHSSAHTRLARGAVPGLATRLARGAAPGLPISSTALHPVSPAAPRSVFQSRAHLIHGAAFGLAHDAVPGRTPDSAPDPSLGLAASR